VPALQIGPRLQAAAGGSAMLRMLPGRGTRAGILALIAAVLTASVVYVVIQGGAGRPDADAGGAVGAGGAPAHAEWPGSRRVPIASAPDAAVSSGGARLVAAGTLKSASAVYRVPVTRAPTAPAAASNVHDFTLSDLTSIVDGGTGYEPPAYLAGAYRAIAAQTHIPWRVLAAVEYMNGGYVNALAGQSSKVIGAVGQDAATGLGAVNARVLADGVAAAAQPSTELVADAQRLAADGATTSPAAAVSKFSSGSAVTPQAALTLAQQMGGTVTSSAPAAAKIAAMQNQAHLLNGLPYIWGGGHTSPAWVVGPGYDCSGFVSDVLHSAGYLTAPQTTQTLPGQPGILNGPGKYVTMYDRTIAAVKVWVKKKKMVKSLVNPATAGVHVDKGRQALSSQSVQITLPRWVGEWKTTYTTNLVPTLDNTIGDEHVIIDIDGQWWESGGDAADGGANQVHPMPAPSESYLKSFNQTLHPAGL